MSTKPSSYWWTEDDDKRHLAVFTYCDSLRNRQEWIYRIWEENEKLYSGRTGFTSSGRYGVAVNNQLFVVTDNVVASIVDSICAMVGATRPRATFQTDGADWTMLQEAKRYQKLTDGLFRKLKVYPKVFRAFRDSMMTKGVLRVGKQNGEAFVDKVSAKDVLVDEVEARDGKFRQMHQRSVVDKEVLKGLYPKLAEKIDHAPVQSVGTPKVTLGPNQIEVMESWHLRSPDGEGDYLEDGRYCVSIRNAVLLDSEYEKDYFPHVFMDFTDPLEGFSGVTPVERLAPLQIKYDKQNRFITKCQERIIVPMIFGDLNATLSDKFMSKEVGLYFRTSGTTMPTVWSPQALGPESYDERDRTVQRMFALAGMNELYTQGKKETNTTSGIAINAATDIQMGRFGPQSEMLEDTILEVAQRLIWVTKDLHDEGFDTEVVAIDKRRNAETIAWSELKEDAELFTLDIEAASLLPRSPSGRLAQASEMLQVGAIDAKTWMQLVDSPDFEQFFDQETSDKQDIMAVCEQLEKGNWESPSSLQNLPMGIRELTRYHNRLRRLKNVDQESLAMFRRWIALADQTLKDAATAPPDQVVGAPAPAPTMGAPPPEGPPMGAGPPNPGGPPGPTMLPS